ncbi:MAG: hypothetical protein ACTHJM_12230 [Marmoricola sp.]
MGRARAGLVGTVILTVVSLTGLGITGQAFAGGNGHRPSKAHSTDGGEARGVASLEQAYASERALPAGSVSGNALVSAVGQAHSMPSTGGAWTEVTNRPYNAETSPYLDPFWSNVGAGFGLVGGRTTALAEAPDGAWFAGTANGGVWRSSDQGAHWTPTSDGLPSLAIGAVAIDPADGSLWVGTGEANTSQDSYAGTGVYRSSDDGATYTRVGDVNGANPLVSHTVFNLAFAPNGTAYAATDNGLWRFAGGAWTEVLAPAGATVFPPYADQVTNVQVVPGSGGSDVIAANAWRSAAYSTNGFYESTDGGLHFSKVTLAGNIDASKIGRTTFAYSKDGSRLYAIVEDPTTVTLQGIFMSTGNNGSAASVAGPWKQIADGKKLTAAGAAGFFGTPGEQSWYNQDLAVDPANPNHLYVGLEEVYQSVDAGVHWTVSSPYWNYSYACDSTNPTTCPKTTHPDQHAAMIADGKIVIGNDGGVYSRPLSDAAGLDGNWTDLNATLHSWQYYDARAGVRDDGIAAWGGLQDNGTSLISPSLSQMVEPASGDGFDVVVDPANGNRAAGEYVQGTTYRTSDGGLSFFSGNTSPSCYSQQTVYGMTPLAGCDPGMRFVTPFIQDAQNANVWLLGGEDVWISTAGWNTSCTSASTCSWQNVFDTGAGNAVTALSSANSGGIVYAAWVGGGGNPGPQFSSGLATNYGGTWHQINMAGLPNRYIAGVTADPRNPAHAYVVFNGYSRRWVPGGGVGHVFETTDGGVTWTDISGNLPDVPSDALLIGKNKLALATDVGVFTAATGQGSATSWSTLGTGLPNTAVNDLTRGPDGSIYAATHGRGIWKLPF